MEKTRSIQGNDMRKSETDLSVLIQYFEIHNKTEGKSNDTVDWYNEVLGLFYRWLVDERLSTTIGHIDEMVIRRFILHLQSRPGCKSERASTHTVANRVRALKAFFAWVHVKGYTLENVLKDVREPKTADLIVDPLTEEEIEAILGAINPATALGARNAAIISLALDTGLRLSEVANLKEEAVHLESQNVKAMGKGAKERFVSFGVACKRALLDYYYHFRVEPAYPGIDRFFLTIDGYGLKSDGIKSMIQRLAKASEVTRLHPHLLRHTYATRFLLNGGDIYLLKSNLGHSSLKMVMNYVHIASQTAAVNSQPYSPLDNMNIKDTRRYRHSFLKGNGMSGHIYPNVGRRRKRNTKTRRRKLG